MAALTTSSNCFICRKHRGLEVVPGGAIFEDRFIYISHAQLWGNETEHYYGHLFVEPKRHVPELGELMPEEARQIGLYMSLAARALQEVCGVDHVYSFVLGDQVPHVHAHLIGRYPGAPKEYRGPRVDEWPGAPRGDADAIAQLAARLRLALASPRA